MKQFFLNILLFSFILSGISSCREDELVVPTEYDILPFNPSTEVNPIGMYRQKWSISENYCNFVYYSSHLQAHYH